MKRVQLQSTTAILRSIQYIAKMTYAHCLLPEVIIHREVVFQFRCGRQIIEVSLFRAKHLVSGKTYAWTTSPAEAMVYVLFPSVAK